MRVVTIDGPAGAGKSTVSRQLAARLGWGLLDTGAMYRAVTLAALRRGLDLQSDDLGELAETLDFRQGDGVFLLDGEDVTKAIRTPDVAAASSQTAAIPRVRECLKGWQRAYAAQRDTVTEGRDQGTVVFPDAAAKFFLTASTQERARRRHAELIVAGKVVTLETVLSEVMERDARDESRAIAPLRPAFDALVIDSTQLGLDEVTNLIEGDLRARGVVGPDR